MRVFLCLLVPFFLSFACAQEELFYSVSWPTFPGCTEDEELLSIDAIAPAVDGVLAAHTLPPVASWERKVKNSNIMGQAESRGGRDLKCDHGRRCMSGCQNYPSCSRMFNCDECGRRQLVQTERVLTHRELKTLEGDLVTACTAALGFEGNTNGKYTQECKTAMSGTTTRCNALVYSPSSLDVMSSYDCTRESSSHRVCEYDSQKYAVHAQKAVTFAGVVTTIDGGDVGVSRGTSITMVESLGVPSKTSSTVMELF
jgi:hypothetical protein